MSSNDRIKAFSIHYPKTYAGLKTAIISFVSLFAVYLVGFFTELQEWASNDNVSFPALSILGKGFVSAAAATVIGFVNAFVNFGQEKGVVPGVAPSYEKTLGDK